MPLKKQIDKATKGGSAFHPLKPMVGSALRLPCGQGDLFQGLRAARQCGHDRS
jgi:hypothetical protein